MTFIDESDRKERQPALGRVIRALREQRGLTAKALAEQANVEVHRVKQIEAGDGGDYNTIVYIRRALGVNAKEFTDLHAAFVKEDKGSGPGG